MKRVLALDTATEALSVALRVNGEEHGFCETVGRGHSERLVGTVQGLLDRAGCRPSDLDGLVCGTGPGSFVGVRVGVAYAKGLAAAIGMPVAGISSVELLALGAVEPGQAGDVAVAIDARMGEVYFAAYRVGPGGPEVIHAPAVLAPEAVPLGSERDRWLGVGTGFSAYPALADGLHRPSVPGRDLPDVRQALRLLDTGMLQFAEPGALEPVYLRDRVALTLDERRRRAPAPDVRNDNE